ncbi:ABC transporter related protein [alpha proteobacterium BAL199]|jgi:branched-chain amino acid transport system ATP-binding protein|nr:ABC transporter related protein [alpha proteobacterium BAL199]
MTEAAVRIGLTVEGVDVRFAGTTILGPVSVKVEPGSVVAVLGANGAGKSTLLRAVAGVTPVSSGRIYVGETEISDVTPERRAALGVGWCPEGRRLFPGLTVDETLDVAAPGGRRERAERIGAMLELFPVLADKRRETAWRLSGGQQQMLAIARAVIAEPSVVLLDEPSLGLAPVVRDQMFATIRRLATSGAAVLLAEQDTPRALSIADRVVVLARGQLILDWPTTMAVGNPHFEQALMGV